jgi:hypothetical protein
MTNEAGKTISFGDVNVTGGQAAIGDNSGATFNQVNHGAASQELDQLFNQAKEIVEEETFYDEGAKSISSVDDELIAMYGNPTGMVSAMQTAAAADLQRTEPLPAEQFEAEKQTWFQRAKRIAPILAKGGLAVGQAVVTTFVSKSPVVAGLLAAIEFAQQQLKGGNDAASSS